MVHFLKKLNFTQNWVQKQYISIHIKIYVIICRLPAPAKVILQLEHHIGLLPHL